MKYFKMLCLLLISAVAFGQEPILKYKDLPREIQKEVRRSDFKDAVKEYEAEKEKDFQIIISPIDRVIKESATARNIDEQGLGGWDRDVLAPTAIYNRIATEANNYRAVLVINDSGVDEDHPVLAGNHWLPESNYSGDPNQHFHGTFVSGQAWKLISELAENGIVQMKDAQLLGSNGSGSLANAVNLVSTETRLFKPRADAGDGIVFCNSWGATIAPYAPLESELEDNYHPNMFWVAAAGNTGGATNSYPASSEWMSSVPALTQSLVRAYYSTIAEWNDISAPGSNVTSTMPGGGFGTGNGTSYAAPLVAAETVIAWCKYGPKLSGDNMQTYLNYIATDVQPTGFDAETGHGLVYVAKILDTDPCGVPGVDCSGTPPDNPDNPDPPTDPSLYYAQGEAVQGFMIPWKYETDNEFRYLYVPSIEFEAVGESGEQEAYEQAYTFIEDFFKNRAIVLLPDMDWYSATKWTGRFINLVAANADIALEVKKITGKQSGSGMIYTATDFSWNQQAFAESLLGVYLIDVE